MSYKSIDADAPQSSFPRGGSLEIHCCHYVWGPEEHQNWNKVGVWAWQTKWLELGKGRRREDGEGRLR